MLANQKNSLLRRPHFFWIFLILSLTAICYLPSLTNGFTNWDDPMSVTSNPLIRELSWKNTAYFFSDLRHAGVDLYKPLVLLSHAIEFHFFKLDPRIYHATNLALHLANCALVYYLILLLGETAVFAFLVAILFGIHPMHVESVAWVTERKDLLYGLFFLASLASYIKYDRSEIRKYYFLSLLLFTLSLLSKPMAVTLPLILILYDYQKKRALGIPLFLEKLPFFVLSLLFGMLTLLSIPVSIEANRLFKFPENLLLIGDALVFYVAKLAFPVDLSLCYPFPITPGFVFPFLPSISLILLTGILLWRYPQQKIVFGTLFFLAAILPTLQIAPSAFLAADRYTYISSIGFFYLAVEIFLNLLARAKPIIKKILWLLPLLIILFLCQATWKRCGVWKNSLTLWSDVLAKYTDEAIDKQIQKNGKANNAVVAGFNNRGFYYLTVGENKKAIADLDRAVGLAPLFAEAFNNRGVAYSQLGQHDKAIENLSEALKIKPNYAEAHNNRGYEYNAIGDHVKAFIDFNESLRLRPNHAPSYNNRGIQYSYQGLHQKALVDFNQAIELDPYFSEAFSNRGNEYSIQGQDDKAIADFDRALLLKPRLSNTWNSRGLSYERLGDLSKAADDYRRTLQVNPRHDIARNNLRRIHAMEITKNLTAIQKSPGPSENAKHYYNLGTLYADQGLSDKALPAFDRAIALDPTLAEAYNNRGSLYQETGEYDKALADYQKALALNSKFTEASFNQAWILEKLGRVQEAITAYRQLLGSSKDFPQTIAQRAKEALKRLET